MGKLGSEWQLVKSLESEPSAVVRLSDDVAWKLFSGTVSKQEVEGLIEISEDVDFASHVLDMRTVMR